MDADSSVSSRNNSCSESAEYVTIARRTIDEATALEQEGYWDKALKKLEAAKIEAERILNQVPGTSQNPESCINAAIDDVKSVRQEILDHITLCNEKLSLCVESTAPPSYEEAMSTVSSNSSDHLDGANSCAASSSSNLSYSELGAVLENMKTDSGAQSTQLIYSCDNVTLYFIASTGIVTVSSGPDTVRVFEVEDGSQTCLPKYYLQIYTFVYPLVPQVSPCIRTEFGAILLPNINKERQEESTEVDSVGLVVPKDKEPEFVLLLENILQTKIVYCDTKTPEPVGAKISNTIMAGAECVSKLLINGAQKAEKFMDGNTPKIIEKINPADRVRRVSPCVSSGIKIAKDVTAVTAGVTGFVASTVGAATMSLGQFLAPHIKRRGSQLLHTTTDMSETEANQKMDIVLNMTAGAVGGLNTVYTGLEKSAHIFGRSLSTNTVHIVKHKYGRPAAEFAQDTFETVSNGVEIGTHIKLFKPSNIVKETAKGVLIVGDEQTTNPSASLSGATTQTSTSKVNSQINGSSMESLVEVQPSSKKPNTPQPASVPVAFSSEILQPTIVSPTYQSLPEIQPAASVSPESSESQSREKQDLLS